MKTAIVTTCYLDVPEYLEKTNKFINYYQELLFLQRNNIILFDNASKFSSIKTLNRISDDSYKLEPSIQRFMTHIPRKSHLEYGYLWRAVYNIQHLFNQYDKIIYLDNDAYIISQDMIDYINNVKQGWHTVYCNRHKFPETGIHIICKDNTSYNNFVKDLTEEEFINKYNGKTMETTLPIENVAKQFVGDRYSEYPDAKIPSKIDFATQVTLSQDVNYGV